VRVDGQGHGLPGHQHNEEKASASRLICAPAERNITIPL